MCGEPLDHDLQYDLDRAMQQADVERILREAKERKQRRDLARRLLPELGLVYRTQADVLPIRLQRLGGF